MVKYDPTKLARDTRDSGTENEVKEWLRGADDAAKFEFIWKVLNLNEVMGLELARTCQLKPIFLEAILEKMLVYSDASSVRTALLSVVHGLGYRRVLEVICSHMVKAPLCVYKTLYWLPDVYKEQDESLRQEVKRLRDEFNERYPNFSPLRSIGTHA